MKTINECARELLDNYGMRSLSEIYRDEKCREIARIFVERDDMEMRDALERVKETIIYLRNYPYNYEEILRDDWGLEPDYLENIISYLI